MEHSTHALDNTGAELLMLQQQQLLLVMQRMPLPAGLTRL
jgi:hypothetical protein